MKERPVMPANELKPCPFCGGKDVEAFQQYPEDDGGMGSYIVRCHSCDAQSAQFIGKGKRDMAIRAWNRRAGDSAREVEQ